MGTGYEIHDLTNRRRFELGKRYRACRLGDHGIGISGTSYDPHPGGTHDVWTRATAFCAAAGWNVECVDDVLGWPAYRDAWPVTESVYTAEEIAARESEPPPAEDASAARVVAAVRKLRAAAHAAQIIAPRDSATGTLLATLIRDTAEWTELDAALAAYDAAHTDAPGVA